MIETLIYVAAGLIAVVIPAIYLFREHNKNRRAKATLEKSIASGLDEPVSLHPVIDPDICIGSAACVAACPEGTILGLIDNRAKLLEPSLCIGHGECQAACPVGAITLVFGTEKRGVDIPMIKGSFESNVPGIYIAGELGGMGLIRNAVNQGQQAVKYLVKTLGNERSNDIYDLVIVGAGPAGIAASLQAQEEKLNFVTIDQYDLGGTILSYPRRKIVMTRPMELPYHGKFNLREIGKEELLEILQKVCDRSGLKIRSREKVETLEREEDCFKVVTQEAEYRARRILLAIGRRGSPRKLDVPGEQSAKVSYRLTEPELFQNLKVLVVGGGDAAIEAALELAGQPGNTVHISYRRENFSRIKEGNRRRIEKAMAGGAVVPLFNTSVTRILPDKVQLSGAAGEFEIANDYVFIFAGGELPKEFLSRAGIEFMRKFGQT